MKVTEIDNTPPPPMPELEAISDKMVKNIADTTDYDERERHIHRWRAFLSGWQLRVEIARMLGTTK